MVAHANTIRSILFHIDAPTLTLDNFKNVHIPSSVPLIYNFQADAEGKLVTLGTPNSLGMRGKYILTKELLQMNLNYLETDNDMLEAHQESELMFTHLIEKSLKQVIEYSDNGRGQNDALIITDGQGVILHTNKAWSRLCGWDNEEIQGRSSEFLQGPLTNKESILEFNASIETGLPTKVPFLCTGLTISNEINYFFERQNSSIIGNLELLL